jgi:pilus assembly protein Flp/PilA
MTNPTISLYVRTTNGIRDVFEREEGASMVEYALLVTLIAMVAIAAVVLVGQALDTRYDSIASSVSTA